MNASYFWKKEVYRESKGCVSDPLLGFVVFSIADSRSMYRKLEGNLPYTLVRQFELSEAWSFAYRHPS